LDEEKWHVFANCRCDPQTGKWEMLTRPIFHIFEQPKAEAPATQQPAVTR